MMSRPFSLSFSLIQDTFQRTPSLSRKSLHLHDAPVGEGMEMSPVVPLPPPPWSPSSPRCTSHTVEGILWIGFSRHEWQDGRITFAFAVAVMVAAANPHPPRIASSAC